MLAAELLTEFSKFYIFPRFPPIFSALSHLIMTKHFIITLWKFGESKFLKRSTWNIKFSKYYLAGMSTSN